MPMPCKPRNQRGRFRLSWRSTFLSGLSCSARATADAKRSVIRSITRIEEPAESHQVIAYKRWLRTEVLRHMGRQHSRYNHVDHMKKPKLLKKDKQRLPRKLKKLLKKQALMIPSGRR
jgi:hypothetical protein